GVPVLISGFVSLTLPPMLCSRFLRPPEQQRHGRLYQASERAFQASLGVYERGLRWSLRRRTTVMLMTGAVMAATIWLFWIIPKGFLPNEDQGQIFTFTQAAEGISFESIVEHQKQLMAIVKADPRVDRFMSSVGSRGFTASNQGILFIRLKPRKQRPPADVIVQQLRGKLMSVPGMLSFPQILPPIRIGGQLTKSQYQYAL